MNRFIAIEILPDHIDLALMHGGRMVGTRRIPVELPNDAGQWCKALRAASGTVANAVVEPKAQKMRAVVLYRSPAQSVDLASIELRSAEQAEETASLDCMGNLTFNMDLAVIASSVVSRDESGEPRRTHVAVAADRSDILEAIVEVMTAASLRVEHLTLMDAAIVAMVTQRAMRRAAPCQAWLYIGEHSSFFLIAGDGRLHFGRLLGLGIDTLARTLTRPIRVRGREDAIELDLATAGAILHRCGIPRGEQIVHEALGLTGTQLRPLVQPVLQRYVVELRQSLRFALPDHTMDGFSLTLLGPGCSLAGFGELLNEELGVRAERGAGTTVHDREAPGGPGSELHDVVQDRSALQALTLLPPHEAKRRRLGEMRRWLMAGSAAALLLVGFDALRISQQVSQVRQQSETIASQVAQDEALETTKQKLTSASVSLQKLESDIEREMHACVSFRAMLQELSLLTPEGVQLTNMTFNVRDGKTICSLRGYAVKGAGSGNLAAGETNLKMFIERLQASALVEKVALLNVERSTLGNAPAESFQAAVDLVSIPGSLTPSQIVAAPGTEEQP